MNRTIAVFAIVLSIVLCSRVLFLMPPVEKNPAFTPSGMTFLSPQAANSAIRESTEIRNTTLLYRYNKSHQHFEPMHSENKVIFPYDEPYLERVTIE